MPREKRDHLAPSGSMLSPAQLVSGRWQPSLPIEGMHQLKHMGCKMAFVSGSSEAANALYSSVMGGEYDISEPWEKIITE